MTAVLDSVRLTRDLPLGHGRTVTVTAENGIGATPGESSVTAAEIVVSPRYFQTVGLAIRQGRAFSEVEPLRPMVGVVNEAMAR